jgi:hypothetical protein
MGVDALCRARRRRRLVTNDPAKMEQLAQVVREALQSADLDAYRELLDPLVSWGPPDDDVSGCHNRDEVLEWYELARDSGVRADVVETVVSGDQILVGLIVHPAPPAEDGDGSRRWQILSVAEGRVKDIRGFEDRDEAVRRLG